MKLLEVNITNNKYDFKNAFEQKSNNKDCYQGSTLNSPLMEIENFDPNKTGFFA